MKKEKISLRDRSVYKFSSAKNYIKFFVPGFVFRHDNLFLGKDKFIGREHMMRKLFMWLTSDSQSGSYLITGYRGMGKSWMVSRVLDRICRPQKEWKELIYYFSVVCTFFSALFLVVFNYFCPSEFSRLFGILLLVLGILGVVSLEFSKRMAPVKVWYKTIGWKKADRFSRDQILKYAFRTDDGRSRRYWRIPIKINLGQEILNERDVLGIIAQNVRDKYIQYVKHSQNRPTFDYCFVLIGVLLSGFVVQKGMPLLQEAFEDYDWWVLSESNHTFVQYLSALLLTAFVAAIMCAVWTSIREYMPYIATPYKAIKRLNLLCERIDANINEESHVASRFSKNIFSISIDKGKNKAYPIANVREIEQELQGIINEINDTRSCLKLYQVKFIIIFDELDKVFGTADKDKGTNADGTPEFDASVEGFSGTMGYEARKRNILHLLANMKLFIATVRAKCIFISGHELYDASLADLSDREFAISSIFNGVLNVDSFLSPERDQNEVSSMTELYLATMLLPEKYLLKKMKKNIIDNDVLKEELPCLRWYNDYLMDDMIRTEGKDDAWRKQREGEIRYAVEFLRFFSIYLAHICNGSPKKIATYFEKYIRTEFDMDTLYDWGDVLTFGQPTERNPKDQCILWFDPNAQRLVNFIFYIASPVMKTISNEVSHYGDKLLVTSSFILDQIYKYHGKGFSWRNLEQMPELLNANKNPELRDSLASMMEFLLQTHITRVHSGLYQYKFHKQIAEEITYISMTSEEASAVFNFTLNESSTVKKYNMKLLDYYMRLAKAAPENTHYQKVIERIHENIGDIYYMDEDYYCAIHEYRNALKYIENSELSPNNAIDFLKCSLKIGMSYEYRRTFENAYMMYCSAINKLIHLRWIDERSIGLDYTSVWTNDWRIKQPMLVDYKALKDHMEPSDAKEVAVLNYATKRLERYVTPSNEEMALGKNFRKQFLSGVWDDIKEKNSFRNSELEYSTQTDNIIQGLSSNFTPEKSDILQRLTVFEDIRYIYLAIIAKLFAMEKMELGGIGYSSIVVAEAEFLYLHSATNMQGKYMIAADFFHKMAEVLYYKNGYVTPIPNVSSLVSALYFYDCNIMGLVDDFCFKIHGEDSTKDVVALKESIFDFFKDISFDEFNKQQGDSTKEKIINLIPQHITKRTKIQENDIISYLKYIEKHLLSNMDNMLPKIEHCTMRRSNMLKIGYKLPCNACRYVYRSLNILTNHIFVEENKDVLHTDVHLPVVIRILSMTSRKHIRHIRQMEMALLANTVEQMGDIMLSCSVTRTKEFDDMSRTQHADLVSFDWNQDVHLQDDISVEAIDLLEYLTGNNLSEVDRINRLTACKNIYFTKIDKALMFYWAASRFYDMASYFKAAAYCMERMLKVIQGYLKVIGDSQESRATCLNTVKKLMGFSSKSSAQDSNFSFPLVENIFRNASKFVGLEFDNYELGEIHEFRWLFHMERMDDVDLSRLSIFTDIKPFLLAAVDVKVRALDYLRRFDPYSVYADRITMEYRQYIHNVYNRICSPLRHDKTFKEEVLGCFMKAQVNKRILVDCLGDDIVQSEKLNHMRKKKSGGRSDLHEDFYGRLLKFLVKDVDTEEFDYRIFQADDIHSRLSLIEYLVQDSFVCLSSILSVLTPHNRMTTFPNFFLAEVYDLMWEWSKYYEMVYDLYLFRKYHRNADSQTMNAIIKMMTRNTSAHIEEVNRLLTECLRNLESDVEDKNGFGYQYTRLLMGIRHDVDDATIHHIFTNVSAQMSTRYYKMAKDINNEGPAYKNMIEGMYVLDDDLRNDTSQSNLADERYLWHCGIIDRKRDLMSALYKHTSTNRLANYEFRIKDSVPDIAKRIKDRLDDSLYLNSEY